GSPVPVIAAKSPFVRARSSLVLSSSGWPCHPVAIDPLHYSLAADVALGWYTMRPLMTLRHAKTERDSPSGNDRDRRLNERGREDAPILGRYIAANRFVPQCVLVS